MPGLVADRVKIGSGAGGTGQGSPTIAIGKDAGTTNQHNNSIILNASGVALNSGGTSRFYVKPVRGGNIAGSALAYTSEGEIVEETNVHFDGSGNVGIGGIADATNTLKVYGNILATSNLEVSNINFTGSFNENGVEFVSSPWITTEDDLSYTSGNVGIGGAADATNKLKVTGSILATSNFEVNGNVLATSNLEVGTANLVVNTSTSNVGIGVADPQYTLDVNGDINIPSVSNLKIGGTTAVFSNWESDTNGIKHTAGNVGIGGASDTTNKLKVTGSILATSNLEVGAANLVVNTSTSRVGIGVADPQYTLDVNGNINIPSVSNLKIAGTTAVFSNWESDTNGIKHTAGNVGIGGAPDATNELKVTGSILATSDFQVGIVANLYVDTSTSNVGIGMTTPQYTLDVNGDINIDSQSKFRIAGDPVGIWTTTGANLSYTSGNVGIGGAADATNELKVYGNVLATHDIVAFSDRRLKSNIERIEGALDKVCALGGYTFTMNDKPSTGLIAQEVLEVLPEAVHGSEETQYSLAYGNMIGLLVEAVKELRALI
jgi:hypothetical protein